MGKTSISIENESFLINQKLTYSEINTSKPESHGMIMNARFIQGIFDDSVEPDRFARWGCSEWDPAVNTQALVDALPEWYGYGLRAFTVGFQGGGPCFTTSNDTIDNNPFGEDGTKLDPAYATRMDTLIKGPMNKVWLLSSATSMALKLGGLKMYIRCVTQLSELPNS